MKGFALKKLFLTMLALIFLAAALLTIRTFQFTSRQLDVAPALPVQPDGNRVASHLSQAVQIATVSYGEKDSIRYEKFNEFHRFLESAFPKVHKQLRREVINDYTLLYRWEGKDNRLDPVLLMAHQDVVPPGNSDLWDHPPFAGEIQDGFVYGRGTMDDKASLISIIAAVEYLLEKGYVPGRTVYLAFGHDEEIGGRDGAVVISQTLKERRISPWLVLDEGMAVVHNMIPGMKNPVGLVGIAEKGYMTLRLEAKGEGGHSSMPPAKTAIGILSEGLTALQNNPLPAAFSGPAKQMFEFIGPEMPFLTRLIFANTFIFSPLLISRFEEQPSTNALIRTTTAITTINGGEKENVLPVSAAATVNFRIRPGDTIESVIRHVTALVDTSLISIVHLNKQFSSEPSVVAPVDSEAFLLLQKTIAQVFPLAVISPGLMVGGSDSRHMETLTPNVYRFMPMNLYPEDLKRIHGIDERISIDDLKEMVRFYIRLLENI